MLTSKTTDENRDDFYVCTYSKCISLVMCVYSCEKKYQVSLRLVIYLKVQLLLIAVFTVSLSIGCRTEMEFFINYYQIV